FDVVAREGIPHDLDFPLDDVPHVTDKLLHRRPEVRPELGGRIDAGSGIVLADRLAKSLRGNRSGLDADPADAALLLDDGDFFSELRRLNGGSLAGRPAADADQIHVVLTLRHRGAFRVGRATGDILVEMCPGRTARNGG